MLNAMFIWLAPLGLALPVTGVLDCFAGNLTQRLQGARLKGIALPAIAGSLTRQPDASLQFRFCVNTHFQLLPVFVFVKANVQRVTCIVLRIPTSGQQKARLEPGLLVLLV